LLFHPDPERFVTGAIVKIGYFRSESELAYQDVIEGTLFTQVDRTVDLLRTKYSKAEVAYSGLYRTETPPVPSEALREAVVNAIAHKDYASPAPIQIRAYDDRLEVWNPGHLPQGWTVDHLTSRHPSIPFNPLIANAFFRAGMIEAWGRGIQRIMDVCETSKVPVPKWRYESGGLRVEFATRHSPRRIESQVTRGPNRGHAGPSTGPSGPYRQAESGHGGPERHRGDLKPTSAVGPAGTAIGREDTASSHYKPSEGETLLLLACVSQPSSARQLLAAAGYEKRAGNFRRKLQQLLDRGLLERTVSIPRSPKQKYRITDTGKAALAIASDQRDAG
jgi:ATP-dependent DNA helicase RecG